MKIQKIRDSLDQYKQFELSPRQIILTKEFFTPLSKSAVKKLIMEMQSKTCELDMLPTKLIKENLDMFLDLLTKIVNISLENGIFAEQWTTVILQQLLKNMNIELISCNYCLVSNHSFLSKFVEKAAIAQLNVT